MPTRGRVLLRDRRRRIRQRGYVRAAPPLICPEEGTPCLCADLRIVCARTYVNVADPRIADPRGVRHVDLQVVVQAASFPEFVHDSQAGAGLKPVNAHTQMWFEHMSPVPMVKPSEASLLGYTHISEPPVLLYMSFEKTRSFRAGAMEECGGAVVAPKEGNDDVSRADNNKERQPAGATPDAGVAAASDTATTGASRGSPATLEDVYSEPIGWTKPPSTRPLQLLQPDASIRSFVPLEEVTEDDHRHFLRPRYALSAYVVLAATCRVQYRRCTHV